MGVDPTVLLDSPDVGSGQNTLVLVRQEQERSRVESLCVLIVGRRHWKSLNSIGSVCLIRISSGEAGLGNIKDFLY